MTTPTGLLFGDPQTRPLSTTGIPQAGCYWCFFLTGTLTAANVYADGALSTPLSQPTPGAVNPTGGTVSNSAGLFVPIYLNPATTYRVQLYNAGGSKLEDTDPYLVTSITAAQIGAALYPQTAAEISASITPTSYLYPEGDIRRYGASTSASDNSTAITNALSVSGAGGSAAYIPGGVWPTTSACVAAPGSSMYGAGATNSVISVANTVDGLQFTSADSTYGGRFFRDFKLAGTLSGTGNAAHGVNASVGSGFLLDILFQNVAVIGFEYGFYLQNLEDCTIQSCLIQNCWFGVYFNNQSVNVFLLDNTINLVSPGTVIVGPNNSMGISCTGSPEAEGIHIQGGTLYGYDYGINFGLVFEVQINAVDISECNVCPIFFQSTVGGLVIRDCWVELGVNANGAFNTANSVTYGNGNICGIFISAITPSLQGHVTIESNYIGSDEAIAGSCGVFIGGGNVGVTVNTNEITGFDVGISGGATTATSPAGGTTAVSTTIKWNRINLFNAAGTSTVYSTSSAPIILNSLASNCEVGPNNIVQGNGSTATIANSSTITVSAASLFPVGTPVQATTTLSNGPLIGVTYFVISSSGTSVTIGPIAGGSATSWTGTGSIGSLVQAPQPIAFNTSATPPGLTFFSRGAFILTISDPALAGPASWVAGGKVVSMTLQSSLTGSAGATTMTGTGLPAFLAPPNAQAFLCGVENNSAAGYGGGNVSASAALSFFAAPGSGAWTNGGTKGLLTTPMQWPYS